MKCKLKIKGLDCANCAAGLERAIQKIDEIENVIIHDLKLGVTRIKAQGGYTNKKQDVLLCVVPNRDYYTFKQIILELDKDAFFIINDCYDIEGGTTKSKERGLNIFY